MDRSVRERVSARDEYEKKVKSKGFQTKEALQNSMLGLQEFMYAIDHASGNKRYIEDIPDFENPILGENRLSSVNKEESHSRFDAVHSPTPTKGVRKPYLRSYTMIYMPFLECIRLLTVLWRSGYSMWSLSFKQMKQNFPLKYFYGERASAIKIQIWVTLIANLLLMVMQKGLKRQWSFSGLATMVRITLMYYVDFYSLFNNPEKEWDIILSKAFDAPSEPSLFD